MFFFIISHEVILLVDQKDRFNKTLKFFLIEFNLKSENNNLTAVHLM